MLPIALLESRYRKAVADVAGLPAVILRIFRGP